MSIQDSCEAETVEGSLPLLLLVLAVAWIAVFAFPALRARRDLGADLSIGSFNRSLNSLNRSTPAQGEADLYALRRSQALQERRRNVMFVLGVATGSFGLLGWSTGAPILLALALLCGLAFGLYLFVLMQVQSEPRRYAQQPQPIAPPVQPMATVHQLRPRVPQFQSAIGFDDDRIAL